MSTAGSGNFCPPGARVLDGVYHPSRLAVLDPCRSASGRVVFVHNEQDGDIHLDVALAAGLGGLLRAGNHTQQSGDLVVEFMPRDAGHLPEPSPNDTIRLVGAWVDDTQHDWNEFHPVWAVSLNGGAWHTSGPQDGGDPAADRSYNAASDCRTAAGAACASYAGAARSTPRPARRPSHPSAPSTSETGFCSTHQCIPSFSQGSGFIVQCRDGMWSHSGGRPGACSYHGGPSGRRYP